MSSFDRDQSIGDEEQIKEVMEYLEPFRRNFEDGIMSLSDMYTNSIANYVNECCNNRTPRDESNDKRNETDKALKQLLLSSLKLSQALIDKYIRQMQQK